MMWQIRKYRMRNGMRTEGDTGPMHLLDLVPVQHTGRPAGHLGAQCSLEVIGEPRSGIPPQRPGPGAYRIQALLTLFRRIQNQFGQIPVQETSPLLSRVAKGVEHT